MLEKADYHVRILNAVVEGWKRRLHMHDGYDYVGISWKDLEDRIVDFDHNNLS